GHGDAVLLEGVQVGAAGDEDDVAAAAGERCTDVGADRTGPDNSEPHRSLSSSMPATRRRCSLPVAVRGIRSTMRIAFGTLNGASRSRQYVRNSRSSALPRRPTAAPTSSTYSSSGSG